MRRLFALSLLRGGDLGHGGLNGGLPMNVMHPGAYQSMNKPTVQNNKYPTNVKQRKVNFSTREVETLLAMVRQYRDAILMSVANGRGWLQAWQSVAKAVSAADGVERSESDCRKKWTYLKWEARHTSKPGRTPTSRAVLDILLNKDSTLENQFAPTRENTSFQGDSTENKIIVTNESNNTGNDQLFIQRDNWEGLLQPHLRTRKRLSLFKYPRKYQTMILHVPSDDIETIGSIAHARESHDNGFPRMRS